MRVVSLANGRSGLIDALRSRGWEEEMAKETAAGLSSAAFHVSDISGDTIEAMLPVARKLGLEMLTGPDWMMLIGARSRIGAFARPWIQPEAVRDLALAIGMAMPNESAPLWRHARGALMLDHPIVMAILNVTPDSFSDAGKYVSIDLAIAQAERLVAAGAEILDVGGESTRPGAVAVSEHDELSRVVPVIDALVKRFPELLISIDTVKSGVAAAALEAGAAIVNDVTAGRHDAEILRVVARSGAGIVLSHSQGALSEIAKLPTDSNVERIVAIVAEGLNASTSEARLAGIADESIALDPGLGFGKGTEANLSLLGQIDALVALGYPVVVGPSRKRFLGEITGRPTHERDGISAVACALACERGAAIFRVHDPAPTIDAVKMAWRLRE